MIRRLLWGALLLLSGLLLGGCEFKLHFNYTIVALYGGEVVVSSSVTATDITDVGKRLADDMRDEGYREVRSSKAGDLVTVGGFRLLDDIGAGFPGAGGMLEGAPKVRSRLQAVGDAVDLVVELQSPIDGRSLEAEAGSMARELLDVGFHFDLVLPGRLVSTNAPRSEVIVVGDTPYTRLRYDYALFRDTAVDIQATTRVVGEVPAAAVVAPAPGPAPTLPPPPSPGSP